MIESTNRSEYQLLSTQCSKQYLKNDIKINSLNNAQNNDLINDINNDLRDDQNNMIQTIIYKL